MVTHSHDKFNRPYAHLSQLKHNTRVIVDGDFTCMKPWSEHRVYKRQGQGQYLNDPQLYIRCKCGSHDLTGQLQDDNETLIGIYLKQEFEPRADDKRTKLNPGD